MHLKAPHELIHFLDDDGTMACIKELRKIYTHNQMRIMAIEDESNDNKTMTAESDHKRVCRAVTPSPTPENEPEQIVTFGSANRFSKVEKGLETERTYEQDRETEMLVSFAA